MIKKGEVVHIKPEFQDEGESRVIWAAIEDEDGDRVRIAVVNSGFEFPPSMVIPVYMTVSE